MRKMLLGSLMLAVAAGGIVTHVETIGIEQAWPFAIGLALAPLGARGRGLVRTSMSVIAGVAVAVGMFVLISLWMPFIPVSMGIMTGVAIALMGVASALMPRAFQLPAMLIAFAVFFAFYEPTWTLNRAGFYGQAPAAAASVLIALFSGLLVSYGASRVLAIEARQRAGEVIPFRARVRMADASSDRPAAAAGGGF
ncbi:MAG: hypothetical protein ACRDKG_06975 [Actinomycetota bacterium]